MLLQDQTSQEGEHLCCLNGTTFVYNLSQVAAGVMLPHLMPLSHHVHQVLHVAVGSDTHLWGKRVRQSKERNWKSEFLSRWQAQLQKLRPGAKARQASAAGSRKKA